ncbi:MAG: uracil-DNA glycosylase family protein [bacterium]|nr:uracil-DNA glycosylase family protein [bacterium]
MVGPVVSGLAVVSRVMLVGQAPGPKEGQFGKPFAWTAGRTMFGWFASIGLEEEAFRRSVYMAAVCRCFPGKNPKGGDRVPDASEIANCSGWLQREMELLKPELVIPVGKLAISQFVDCSRLIDVIGQKMHVPYAGHHFDMIALPHPSGASTWHRVEPGKSLLQKALRLIGRHPALSR